MAQPGAAGSIQGFVAFVRATEVSPERLVNLQKVAEQLLLATGATDLLSVSAAQIEGWRAQLMARNPTEAQAAMLTRGLSAVEAYRISLRSRAVPVVPPGFLAPRPSAAVPAPVPASSGASSGTQRGARKWLTVGALAAVVAGSILYTVKASREAVLENRSDKTLLAKRNNDRPTGIFYPAYTFTKQVTGCKAAELVTVNQAVAQAEQGHVPAANQLLEAALQRDPACVAAARLLTIFAQGHLAQLLALRQRFVALADQAPQSATAQLMAAFAVRAMGDSAAYRTYLDRATAADPNQPLLDGAWGSYWDRFVRPRDFEKELAADRRETERTGDPATLANLFGIYKTVDDFERAADACRRFYLAVPDEPKLDYAATCLKVAIVRGDRQEEATYLKRYFATAKNDPETACLHADVSTYDLGYSCRADDALREAETAISGGCTEPGKGAQRSALLALKRYQEASVAPPHGRYWEGVHGEERLDPRAFYSGYTTRAMALVMLNQDQAALDILPPIAERDDLAQILIGMIENGVARDRIGDRPTCKSVLSRAERLAGAAAGYLRLQMFDEARALLDQAAALDPKSGYIWAVKVYLLSLDGKVDEAVKAGEQALAQGLQNPALAGNLGYAYQQLGQCDKAIPLFKVKMAGEPWTVPNYTNLAKCLEAVGQDAEAKATWKYVQWGRPGLRWWMLPLLGVLAVALYLAGKIALIALWPKRFGHWKFP